MDTDTIQLKTGLVSAYFKPRFCPHASNKKGFETMIEMVFWRQAAL